MWHKIFTISKALNSVEDNSKRNEDMSFDEDSSDDNSMLEGKGKTPFILKFFFRRHKFAFIGVGVFIFFCIIFMMVIIVPVLFTSQTKYTGNFGSVFCYTSADTYSSIANYIPGCSEISVDLSSTNEWYYVTNLGCYVEGSKLSDNLPVDCPNGGSSDNDIPGSGGSFGSSSGGSGSAYTNVTGNVTHWWPVGSSETTTVDGVIYASGPPLSTNITSSFGNQEEFRTSRHGGIDIGNGGNGPGVVNIIAVKDGVVTYPSNTSQTIYDDNGYYGNRDGDGFGNYVMISHNDGTVSVYAHLSKNTITVYSGDNVKQGQVIAKMGNSGSSTGTHLHFEIRVNGSRVYPLNYISASNTRP